MSELPSSLWKAPEAIPPAKALRNLIRLGKIEPMPGSFNALSAQILEKTGIRCSLLGGSAASNTLLGLPDAEFLTLDQLAIVCSFATSATSIPIVVDIDTGYGNSINVTHAVRTFEQAGAAGILMEDQVAPKRSGHIAGKQVVPIEEMVGKLRAAAAARVNPDFVIIARCDARATEGPEGAIRRGNAYAEAGAEGTFIDGAISREELARFAKEIHSQFRVANMGGSAKTRTTPKLPLEELQAMGYSFAVFGLQMTRAAALGMTRFASELRQKGALAEVSLARQLDGPPIGGWSRFIGRDRSREIEARYLQNELDRQ